MNQDYITSLLGNGCSPNLSLPDPILVQVYDDLEHRTIWIQGEIDETCLDHVSKIVRWNREDKDTPVEQRKPIKLIFWSNGGSLEVEETLVEVIKLSKTPIYGYAIGMVASAASLIFLSCHKRFATKNGYLLLHKGSCSNISGNFNEVMASMDDYRKQIDKMIDFYINNTQYTEEEIRNNINTDWYIRGNELLEKGMVHDWIKSLDELI